MAIISRMQSKPEGWAKDLAQPLPVCRTPDVVRIDPYHVRIAPGEAIELRVLVTNHRDQAQSTRVQLELPSDRVVEPPLATGEIGSHETLGFPSRVTASRATQGRVVLCADVALGSRRLGHYAEAIVDLQG